MTLDEMALALAQSADYRVLRRLVPRTSAPAPSGISTIAGLVVDVETTGLDTASDEVIELAMLPFTFTADGDIWEVGAAFQGLQRPGQPISAEITRITGIDDAMVAGHDLDLAEVERLATAASVIIAHRAEFDRPFLERVHPVFASKAWACSQSEIEWHDESTKLAWLLAERGWFYDRHRAVGDCEALLSLLSMPGADGRTALAALLERAREPTWRIWALNSPFPTKDVLKGRGYRWSAGEYGYPKSWYIDVATAAQEDEIEFLRGVIFRSSSYDPRVDKLTAFTRFKGGI